jgi:hypothetical protein
MQTGIFWLGKKSWEEIKEKQYKTAPKETAA